MPPLAWRLLHVLALCSLAVTQPLLSILGDNPTFFTAHDASPGQIVWLAVLVAIVPAAVLGLIESAAHLVDENWGTRVHLVIMAALVFLFTVQIVDVLPGPWPIAVLAAVAVSAALLALYVKQEAARSVVSLLALTPIAFTGLFVFASPAADIVFPDDVAAVDLGDLLEGELGRPDAPVDSLDGTAAPDLTVGEQINRRFPPIYLLVLDELPMASLLDETGEIDRARWPNFAQLADTSHLFSNATAVGFTTERAVPSILTGRIESHDAPVYSLYPENLFTLLGDIYDASSSDPLVELCPPSICDGAPPQAILDLLATEPDEDPSPESTSTSTAPPAATSGIRAESDADDTTGSFRLLLDDALIVFGHLATPEGLDVGLPSIGSSWGNFGGDLAAHAGPGTDSSADPTGPISTTTSTTSTTTTTTTSLPVEVGHVPADEVVPVDAEAITEANREFLDSLIGNDLRVADFRSELADITASDVPRLHFLHTLLPHVPWRLHPGGQTYADIDLPGYFSEWDSDPDIARAGMQRHLLQLQFTDRLLGEYLDQLDREGIFDDAIVAVVADHGIAFVPGSRSRGVGTANLGGIAGVPLFVKLPGQTEGERHHNPVETIDIVPTIAAALGIEVPWALDGVDLFDADPDPTRHRAVLSPFSAEIPEPYQPVMDEVTAELLAVFGNGTTGSLYGLAGLHDRIGQSVASLVDEPTSYCWLLERPTSLPDPEGNTGYVYGRLQTSRPDRIPLAITIGDTLTGTSVTLDRGTRHRVIAFGDPAYWLSASPDDIGLHEIVDGRLRPIPTC